MQALSFSCGVAGLRHGHLLAITHAPASESRQAVALAGLQGPLSAAHPRHHSVSHHFSHVTGQSSPSSLSLYGFQKCAAKIKHEDTRLDPLKQTALLLLLRACPYSGMSSVTVDKIAYMPLRD